MRILKKLTIVDYFLFIIFLVTLVAFFQLFFRKSSYINLVMKVTEQNILYSHTNPPYWFAFLFKEGMVEKDGLGRTTAEIQKVYSYDTSSTNRAVYLNIRLKTTYSQKNNQHKYKGTTIAAGESLRVNFEKIVAVGLITSVDSGISVFEEKPLLVKVRILYDQEAFPQVKGVEPFINEAIKTGSLIKDSEDRVVAEVVSKQVVPAKRFTFDDRGNVYQKNDPLFLDITLGIKILTKKVGQSYYFLDDLPIKVDSLLPLHFENLNLYPTIVSFTVL